MSTGRVEEAETAYKNVVTLAPNHLDARRSLSAILHKLGRPDEALHTLTQGGANSLALAPGTWQNGQV